MKPLLCDLSGNALPSQPSKVVCVGRNYLAHIKELNNPQPEEPLLFIKPTSTLVNMQGQFQLSRIWAEVHYELELAFVVSQTLTAAQPEQIKSSLSHVGLALDLTSRSKQTELKKQGHPWEIAKGFDGACPVSPFIELSHFPDWRDLEFTLAINGDLKQHGKSRAMITPVDLLISKISHYFTLLPGDLVLTGTPAGVGQIKIGDHLECTLGDEFKFVVTVN